MPIEKKIIDEITQLISQKKFADALKKIKPVLEQNPTNVTLLLDSGYVLGSLAQYKDAAAAYEKVIQLAPKMPSGYTGLGFIYRKQDENEKAAEHFKKAAELSPDNAMVHYELAGALFDLDRYEEALQSAYKAIQWGGKETEAETMHLVAQIQLGLQNPDKAIEVALKLLEKDPGFISAENIIGVANFMKEDWKAAITAFDKYLKQVPDDDAAQNLLGQAKERLTK